MSAREWAELALWSLLIGGIGAILLAAWWLA